MTKRDRIANVLAEWDEEAEVWMARSYDIPGLVLSAPTKNELVEKIKVVARPLVEANMGEVPYNMIRIEYIKSEIIPVLAA
jgi:predicted RNase H-like HicB family nuclease